MAEHKSMQEKLITEFTENYMQKIFYFCLKKTGNGYEAEDLTQDIALNIFQALSRGTIPTSFSGWVWQIARNRYSAWADKKHRHTDSVTGSDIGDYEIEDDSENVLDEMLHREQLALLRRELAFIRSDYRDIVVAYYIKDRSVRDISASLSLTEDTVKQRLRRARIILKEGMDMAREFGKRSYNPEQVAFVMNGRDGKKGQPWSIIKHLLYKNIFLETHDNPETAEELSLELGVALPYMESELEFLVEEQLLKKEGNKYQTNFPIISKEEQKKEFDINKRIQKSLTDKICELIDTYIGEDGAKVNYGYVGYEAAKWTLIVRTFDWMQWSAQKDDEHNEYKNGSYPERPDGGAWTLTGFEMTDWEEPLFVGQHGWHSYDENEITKDVDFGQFKFHYKNIQALTPEHLTYQEAYALWLVCSGSAEKADKACVERLIKYGYIKEKDGAISPNLVVFDREAKSNNEAVTAKLSALNDEILELMALAPNIERGYVVEQAIQDGWLKYDENTVKTIGSFIYL